MKAGLKSGNKAQLEILVDKSMFASFGGKLVHELFSTAAVVEHMEWAARKTLLPYLDSDEEGMGCQVNVKHLAPALAGSKVRFEATVLDYKENKLLCRVEAFCGKRLLAQGEITQALVKKSRLKEEIEKLELEQKRLSTDCKTV